MVRYIIKAGRKIKLLPPAIPPEENLHCLHCQVNFDAGYARRACFDTCGHLGCLQCIFNMKDGCHQCANDAASSAAQTQVEIEDDELIILDGDEEDPEIVDLEPPNPPSLPIPSISCPPTPLRPQPQPQQQPVLVLSSVLRRSAEDDGNDDAFPEISRLSLSTLPILEYIAPQEPSPNMEPLVITLDDDEDDEEIQEDEEEEDANEEVEEDEREGDDHEETEQEEVEEVYPEEIEEEDDDIIEVPFDQASSAWESDKRVPEFIQDTSQFSAMQFSDDEEEFPDGSEPVHRILRQRSKSVCSNYTEQNDITAEPGASEFGKFTCKYCSQSFINRPSLGRHMYRVHWDIRPFPCYVCDWPFSTQRNLEIHMLTHTDERPYKCPDCDSAFNRQFTLDNHLSKIHGIAKPKARRHSARRPKRMSEMVLDLTSFPPTPPDSDIQEEPESIPSIPLSTVNTVEIEHLDDSIDMEQSVSTPSSCDDLDQEQKENMVRSLKNHGIDPPNKGTLLKRIYMRRTSPVPSPQKRKKRKYVRKNVQKRLIHCMHCSEIFPGKSKLAVHMRQLHSNVRPYTCDLCGWCFSHKNRLKLHRVIHTIDRPHKCKQCEATFNRKYSLERHVRIMHLKKPRKSEAAENKASQKKPAMCPYCGRRFETKELMAKHMKKRHEELQPHICSICQFPFARQNHLNAHQKCVHSKDRPFQCLMCQSKYNKRFSLERHMESVHGIRIRLSPVETAKEEEYCPECQSLFGSEGCAKVAYSECGHVSCMECVIRAELGCGQCTTENAPKSWSTEPQSPAAQFFQQPELFQGQIDRLNLTDEVVMDVQMDVEVSIEEQQKNYEDAVKICKVHETVENSKIDTKSNGSRIFYCCFCKEPFPQKVNLGLHMQHKHGDLRPYPCDICQWPFASSRDLERHRYIHTNERPFRCNLCPVTFNRKSTRDRHVEKIHLKWRRI